MDPAATGPPPAPPSPEPPSRPRLPGEFAWLLGRLPPSPTVSNPIAVGQACLRSLLTDPELLALIDAAPQAGRLLRPLCRALGVALPAHLKPPARPGQAARAAARPEARQAARAEARAAREAARAEARAAREAARAEAAWGRRYRRSLGLPSWAPKDALPLDVILALHARPPPKRA